MELLPEKTINDVAKELAESGQVKDEFIQNLLTSSCDCEGCSCK